MVPSEIKKVVTKTTLLEFNYASFSLEPYSGSNSYSSKLLKEVITKLGDHDLKERVKDRYKGRAGSSMRRIVHISAPFEAGGKRCFGKMALIKDKAPMTWGGKDDIEEIENPKNREFIEVTNYIIHFHDNADPVLMFEHNYSGPRLSDIEYYFRQICKEFRLAKSIKSVLHLQTQYDQLDNELENVFNLEVKVNSHATTKKANWLKGLAGIKTETGFRDIRMQLFFNRKRDGIGGKLIKNIVGLDYTRDILGWLKQEPNNIEHLQDLKLEYQVSGDEDVRNLDFLKNKTTSVIKIPLFNNTQYRPQDFKHHVGQEFNYYLTEGKTHIEESDAKLITNA